MGVGALDSSLLQALDADTIDAVLTSLHLATQVAPEWGKAWHHWALFNVQVIEAYQHTDMHLARQHVAHAVTGFFRSVALGQSSGTFLCWQDGPWHYC